MLTADLVRARRVPIGAGGAGGGAAGGPTAELRLVSLDRRARERALELCESLLAAARAHIGRTRDELEETWSAVEAAPRDRRLLDALRKLVEDRCVFDSDEALDPEELRRELFTRSAAARRDLVQHFDRAQLVSQLAAERGLALEALERGLYADLRGAQLLRAVRPVDPRALVESFDVAQAQAVLLRAVRVVCDVRCASAGAYRALFHRLKFLRLLYAIERQEGGYRLTIDGPYSLFESATRYGLQLAMALPALAACDAFALEAEVRWGRERERLAFRFSGESAPQVAPPAGEVDDGGPRTSRPPRAAGEVRLPDEVAALKAAVAELEGPWRATPSTKILDLPGVGLCVPDLELRRAGAPTVYLEVLGFWSRDAVWRRVELVERGLRERILFAVSQHLRVSEQALGDDLPGALYVYKRVMNARAVLDRADRLVERDLAKSTS